MNISEQHWYPKGYFPLLLRVEDKMASNGDDFSPKAILKRFVAEAKNKYDLQTMEECLAKLPCDDHERATGFHTGTCQDEEIQDSCTTWENGSTAWAETHIAVPFPDKEMIRIDYNIFSSLMDEECGNATRFHFHMESDF